MFWGILLVYHHPPWPTPAAKDLYQVAKFITPRFRRFMDAKLLQLVLKVNNKKRTCSLLQCNEQGPFLSPSELYLPIDKLKISLNKRENAEKLNKHFLILIRSETVDEKPLR